MSVLTVVLPFTLSSKFTVAPGASVCIRVELILKFPKYPQVRLQCRGGSPIDTTRQSNRMLHALRGVDGILQWHLWSSYANDELPCRIV